MTGAGDDAVLIGDRCISGVFIHPKYGVPVNVQASIARRKRPEPQSLDTNSQAYAIVPAKPKSVASAYRVDGGELFVPKAVRGVSIDLQAIGLFASSPPRCDELATDEHDASRDAVSSAKSSGSDGSSIPSGSPPEGVFILAPPR